MHSPHAVSVGTRHASPLTLTAAAAADVGRVRALNEDAVLAHVRPSDAGPALALLVVADGMGGHQAGEIAGRLAVNAIHASLRWFLQRPGRDDTRPLTPPGATPEPARHLGDRLRLAVAAANETILAYALDNPVEAGNLGSTVTCALIHGRHVAIANVGDCRAYLHRDGRLRQLTADHSYVGRLVRAGHLAPDAIFDHPRRNLVTRTLGHRSALEVDIFTEQLQPGDRLLLCSDGLWEMVRDDALIAAELAAPPATAVAALVALANAHGGEDNIGIALAAAGIPN